MSLQALNLDFTTIISMGCKAEWWATSLGAWQAERLVVTAADNCL